MDVACNILLVLCVKYLSNIKEIKKREKNLLMLLFLV